MRANMEYVGKYIAYFCVLTMCNYFIPVYICSTNILSSRTGRNINQKHTINSEPGEKYNMDKEWYIMGNCVTRTSKIQYKKCLTDVMDFGWGQNTGGKIVVSMDGGKCGLCLYQI